MLDHILNAITGNPWVLAAGTVAFFTIKGVLWLLIPFLVIRWRKLVARRYHESQNAASEYQTSHAAPIYLPESKRAA
jgi:hypothetical protein